MSSSLIGNLAVNLDLETAAFSRGAKKAKAEASGLQKTMAGIGSSLKVLGAGLIAGLGVEAVTGAISRSLEYASSLGEVSQQLGVTTSELQRYRYIASQVGIEQAEMDKGLAFLSRTLGDLSTGAKGPAEALKKLGFSAGEVTKIAKMSAGDAIPLLADKFALLKSPTEQAALAADLFGAKLGGKFLTLLAGGSAGINGLADSYKKLGMELTPEQIQKADDAADKLSAMKQVLEAKIAGFVADNSETILRLAEGLGSLAEKSLRAGEAFGTWSSSLSSKSSGINGYLKSIEDRAKALDAQLGIPPKEVLVADLQDQFRRLALHIDKWLKWTENSTKAFDRAVVSMVDGVSGSLERMVSKVGHYMGKRLREEMEAGRKTIQQASNWFYKLYDDVVGHSYIPDMVNEVGQHIARLDAVMTQPVKASTGKAAEAFRQLQSDVSAILHDLYPEQTAHNEFMAKLSTLQKGAEKVGLSAAQAADAVQRLIMKNAGDIAGPDNIAGGMTAEGIGGELPKIEDVFNKLARKAEITKVSVVKSFSDMAQNVVSSLQGLHSSIKDGGFLDILGALANVFTSLGSAGAFGKGIQANLSNSYANRANGGPVFAGRSYMVGERGKELFTPSRSGYIRPNKDSGFRQQVGVIVSAAPQFLTQIVQGDQLAAATGSAGAQTTMLRRQQRSIP